MKNKKSSGVLINFQNLVSESSYSKLKHGMERVFQECLQYKGNEKILIISDRGEQQKQIAGILANAAYDCAGGELIIQEARVKGDACDPRVIKALRSMHSGIVILALSNKLGSLKGLGTKSFRNFMGERGLRFISSTGLVSLNNSQIDMLSQALDVDYASLRDTGENLKQKLSEAKEAVLISKNGTNLKMILEGREPRSNVGTYYEKGKGGNMPTGEVYIAPVESKTEGTLVIDTMRTLGGTEIVNGDVELTIKNGSIVDIKGSEAAQRLMRDIIRTAGRLGPRTAKNCFKISEFSIGINPNAPRSGVMVIDEKRLGTAHVAIGSNYWFGGALRCPLHLDQIVENAEIYLDGEKLVL